MAPRSPGAMLLLIALLLAVAAAATAPLAPYVVLFAARGEEVVFRLGGLSPTGRALTTTVLSGPASPGVGVGAASASAPAAPPAGALHELSQLFLTQGLQPRRGRAVGPSFPFTLPAPAGNRLLLVTPSTPPPPGAWGNFTYRVQDGPLASNVGVVWVIPPHKRLAHSDFRADTDGWRVSGRAGLSREAFSRGLLSQYLVGTDGEVVGQGRPKGPAGAPSVAGDASLWRFVAPPHFLGNKAAAYGGSLTFTAGAFSGDFSPGKLHSAKTPLVVLECASCAGGAGVRLGHFVADPALLDGKTKKFTVALTPSAWRRDPRNSLVAWAGGVGDCELVAVLQGLSGLSILGDWSAWYETVALDDVALNVAQPWPGLPKACVGGA
jgi:hypothetical protein